MDFPHKGPVMRKAFSWHDVTISLLTLQASSPACTELETIVMDWLGKMIGLPAEFLHSNQQTKGGGVIQVLNYNN